MLRRIRPTAPGSPAVLVLAAVAASVAGCTVDNGTSTVLTQGSLLARWTIEEMVDPTSCVAFRTDRMQVIVDDLAGNTVTVVTPPCSDFLVDVVLVPMQYTATLTLLDPSGLAASTSITTNPFSVFAGAQTILDSDFPASAFFPVSP